MSQPSVWGAPRIADAPQTPEQFADRTDDSLDALLSANSGATRPAYAVAGTVWFDTDIDQLFLFDGTIDRPIAMQVDAPASASDTGTAGQVAWDADYIYVCTATDTWKRVAIATWP
jgi:hypothetical protein